MQYQESKVCFGTAQKALAGTGYKTCSQLCICFRDLSSLAGYLPQSVWWEDAQAIPDLKRHPGIFFRTVLCKTLKHFPKGALLTAFCSTDTVLHRKKSSTRPNNEETEMFLPAKISLDFDNEVYLSALTEHTSLLWYSVWYFQMYVCWSIIDMQL